ncbi:MAG: hypothetical protein U0Q19_20860 [Kineosporiaceae bacterium]
MSAPVVCSVLVLVPFAAVTWQASRAAIPWAIGSAAAELIYFRALARQYRALPVERSYPVARGTAPLLVLGVGLVVGRAPGGLAALGVAVLGAGVALTAGTRADVDRTWSFTLPVSAAIATYTLLDSFGIRHAGPTAYLLLTMAPVAAVLLAGDLRTQGVSATLGSYRSGSVWLAGSGITGAYLLVLLALSRAAPDQAAVISGLRETSVVMVPLLAWLVLRRRPSGAVLAGSALVLAGLVLVRIAG